jgi:hypothetical protein
VHASLVTRLFLHEKYRPGLSPARFVAHACYKPIRPTAVDIENAWAAAFRIAATGRGGRHGHRKNVENASYVLVNFYGFFLVFFPDFSHGPLSGIPVKQRRVLR